MLKLFFPLRLHFVCAQKQTQLKFSQTEWRLTVRFSSAAPSKLISAGFGHLKRASKIATWGLRGICFYDFLKRTANERDGRKETNNRCFTTCVGMGRRAKFSSLFRRHAKGEIDLQPSCNCANTVSSPANGQTKASLIVSSLPHCWALPQVVLYCHVTT